MEGNLTAALVAYINETVSTIANNRFLDNGGIGLFIIDLDCFYLSNYLVADNVADGNGDVGMFATAEGVPGCQPAGSGNGAQHNGAVQCVLIVCAKNRGQAKQEWAVVDPRPLAVQGSSAPARHGR